MRGLILPVHCCAQPSAGSETQPSLPRVPSLPLGRASPAPVTPHKPAGAQPVTTGWLHAHLSPRSSFLSHATCWILGDEQCQGSHHGLLSVYSHCPPCGHCQPHEMYVTAPLGTWRETGLRTGGTSSITWDVVRSPGAWAALCSEGGRRSGKLCRWSPVWQYWTQLLGRRTNPRALLAVVSLWVLG